MGYYPLVRSDRDVGVKAYDRQLFLIDSSLHPQPAVVVNGSLAGFQYTLPPLMQLRPVVQIIAYPAQSMIASANAAGGFPVAIPGNYNHWFLTLREPDGTYIVRDSPLQSYVQIPASGAVNVWPKYFNTRVFPDPRQSFLVCVTDGRADLVAIEFVYR